MTKRNTLLLIAALLLGTASAHAASHGGAPMGTDAKQGTAAASNAEMADGEIRKIDMENKKITIKHGVIKSLDMPAMTMVFHVKDAALLGKAKVGDKVRFSAEQAGSAILVTEIQPAK